MAKRDFGSAFSYSEPEGMIVATGNGFDAPQPQAQLYAPDSPTALLRIPGQWPQEQSFVAEDEASHFTGASFFTTESKFATCLTCITRILAMPVRLAQRFLRQQTIRALPVISEQGARKKRLVDAGPADAPYTPTRPRARVTRRHSPSTPTPISQPTFTQRAISPVFSRLSAAFPVTASSLADWSPSPTPPSNRIVDSPVLESLDVDSDDDFSFSDVVSGTPPHNPHTGSPVKRVWNPRTLEFQARSPAIPLLQTSPSGSPHIKQFSPSAHQRILRNAAITPTQRHLHRVQLRARLRGAAPGPSSPQADHTIPSPALPLSLNSELKEREFKASALKLNAEHIAHQANLANERYKAVLQTRDTRNTEIRAAEAHDVETAPTNLAHTVDEDLSTLPDANNDYADYENDLSFLEDAPAPPRAKSVRWTEHGDVKPFYFDERVSEMLDSTLETIASSPVRTSTHESDSSEDDRDNLSVASESPTKGSPKVQANASTELVGFHGVPADTWDSANDDSLDESQISIELFEELQADLEKKLALAPRPVVKTPLVAPLTKDEKALLDSAAAKTNHGLDQDAHVVKRKLSARDFGTLLPAQFNGSARAWLNDEIVNEYLSILVGYEKHSAGFEHKRNGPAPHVHAFTSHWYTSIQNGAKAVERWAGRVQLAGKQYLDAELLLYPICDGSHWRLLAVKPKARTIEYLDSLGLGGTKYIAKMREYLAHELKDLYIAEEWNVIEHQRSARQLNGSDCGVFTLLNALALLRDEEAKRVVACEGMLEARERIAITLMAGRPTTEMN
ncbi:cysteine proteinase [Dothidotthia symphoricarpi CBS 119687]|uniref:Cysteine proteinase n=1 Tax=Dothidotthia symphoricarpi CBS 119687 TaxID=1392245 RepID=A0A6A6AEB4_9PLEO|nr:cysteine proteinase [Dothidotthia symphoricarpi CBS 119687]KAF2129284.1 cysteine proteinase [Dothidotthia symphoricarpi CBS 119687]